MRKPAPVLIALCLTGMAVANCGGRTSSTSADGATNQTGGIDTRGGTGGQAGGGGTGGAISGSGGGKTGTADAGQVIICPPCMAPPDNCPFGLLPGTGPCGCGATCAPAPDGGNATPLPQCAWPQALSPTDAAASAACRAARVFATCLEENGQVSTGLRADLTNCQNRCADTEYGVACGAVGSSLLPIPEPPAGCRLPTPTPGGVVFYCCPCL